jgi:Carboxypeptidase regulatory-like domain
VANSRLARIVVAAVVAFLGTAPIAGAQTLVTVHGLAYDSLHGAALSGAFIGIAGTSRTTISDDRGRFVFDSVVPGTYRFVMQHDVLDSIGMSGTATRMAVSTGRDTVTISVPSFATLWRATCRTPPPPSDSGLVFGTVREIGGQRTASGANVSASWLDMTLDSVGGVKQHGWRAEVRTDSTGYFSLCGVPTTTGIRLRAVRDSAASGFVDLMPLDRTRIQRRDLMLGDSTSRGTIAGIVTGQAGKPQRDALVVSDAAPETRTDANGRFLLREIPVGTQQIEVRAIGLAPVVATVDVVANDTAHVDVQLVKVVTLDTVRTKTTPGSHLVAEFEARRRAGWGTYRDSTTISKHGTVSSVFAEMPSVTVRTSRRGIQLLLGALQCPASIWIDGRKSDQRDLLDLQPDDIAAIEVYSRKTEIPTDLVASSASGGCGAAIIWTKRIWP